MVAKTNATEAWKRPDSLTDNRHNNDLVEYVILDILRDIFINSMPWSVSHISYSYYHEHNCRNFADDIYKCIFKNEKPCIMIQILLTIYSS